MNTSLRNMANIYIRRPMKKKNGTSAGIPRASGERNSPAPNGFSLPKEVSKHSCSLSCQSSTLQDSQVRISELQAFLYIGTSIAKSMLWVAGRAKVSQFTHARTQPTPISLSSMLPSLDWGCLFSGNRKEPRQFAKISRTNHTHPDDQVS
jgi:hypothetical protein